MVIHYWGKWWSNLNHWTLGSGEIDAEVIKVSLVLWQKKSGKSMMYSALGKMEITSRCKMESLGPFGGLKVEIASRHTSHNELTADKVTDEMTQNQHKIIWHGLATFRCLISKRPSSCVPQRCRAAICSTASGEKSPRSPSSWSDVNIEKCKQHENGQKCVRKFR